MRESNLSYEVKIDFPINTREPQRIFHTMAELIEEFTSLDSILTESFPIVSKITIELESVEIGSIKTKLRSVLELIPDTAIEDLSWKKIIGSYLVKAKHSILSEISEIDTITDRETVERIRDKVARIAKEETGYVSNISTSKLLNNISKLSQTMRSLGDSENAIYISSSGAVVINKNFNLSVTQIEELLVSDVDIIDSNVRMQIKKPDYTGRSKWDFHLNDHVVSVKIKDIEWLGQFQSGNVVLRPGDGVEALIRVERNRDDVGLTVSESYELLKVHKIIHQSEFIEVQTSLIK